MRTMIIILAVIVIISVPLAISYTPQGKFIHWDVEPAKNETLGGVFTFDCPASERAYAILENGTFLCRP